MVSPLLPAENVLWLRQGLILSSGREVRERGFTAHVMRRLEDMFLHVRIYLCMYVYVLFFLAGIMSAGFLVLKCWSLGTNNNNKHSFDVISFTVYQTRLYHPFTIGRAFSCYMRTMRVYRALAPLGGPSSCKSSIN